MSPGKRYNQEELLDEVSSILEEINATSDEDEKLINELEGKTQVTSSFAEAEDRLLSFIPVDGHIDIKVSDDKLKVHATFYPPGEGGTPLSLQMLSNELKRENIKNGYNPELLIDNILKCNLDHKIQYDLKIQEGSPPVSSQPERIIIARSILNQFESYDEDDFRNVDFKDFSQFIVVKKGDFIGELKAAIEGRDGIDVYGNSIPFKKIKSNSLKLGKNLIANNGFISSTIEGKLNITDKLIFVEEVLVVKTNVDYRTGNIDYPKDIIIKGEVADGFSINAGGNILFEKVLDASKVTCKGNLTVNYGIIGKGNSLVKTEGNLKAGFIDHCKVYAGGDLDIKKSILNSEIYCGGRIKMSKSGVIIGGVSYCTNGLQTFELGSKSDKQTEVFCGIDFVVQKKLEWVRDQNIKLVSQFKKINVEIDRQTSDLQTQLIEKREQILSAISLLQENAKKLVYHLDKNEDAEIIVTGTVYPGVYIEICHVSCHVFKEIRHVRFFLDKEKGKVVSEKLS